MAGQSLTRAPVRMRLALIMIFVLGGLLGARLFYWQIVQWDKLRALAERQTTADVDLPARRGDIRTKDDLRLATDVYLYTIAITPASVPQPDELSKQLAPVLKQSAGTILAKLNSKDGSVVLARDVPV